MANIYQVYELHIRVVEARNLKVVQSFGMMDPFVLVRVGTEEKSSAPATDGHVAPHFNYKTFIQGNMSSKLEIVVINKGGVMSSNKFIGRVEVPFANLLHGRVEDTWLPLDSGGEVHVRLQLMYPGEKPIEQAKAPAPAPVPAPAPAPVPAPVPAPAPAPVVSAPAGPSQAELAAMGRTMLAAGMGGGYPSAPSPAAPVGYPPAGGYPPAYSPAGGYPAAGYPPASHAPGYGYPAGGYPAASPGHYGTPPAGVPGYPGMPGAYPGAGMPGMPVPGGMPGYAPGVPPPFGYTPGVPPPAGYTPGMPGYGPGYPAFPR